MFNVIKENKDVEPYSEEKVLSSIKRAGVPLEMHASVLAHINGKAYNNIPTKEIYHHITEYLAASPYPYTKSMYSLKQSVMALGPTGYPFEDFVAELLTSFGYSCLVRQTFMGACVSHEVDIVAEKPGLKAMIEAKFHNALGTRSDVRIPLYTHSRFQDIKEKYQFTEGWVVTNTKATTDAIAYAECVGMKIISWSHPEKGSLRELIEQAGLHPITMLTTLSLAHKTHLLENHSVRCKAIHENPSVLDGLSLSHEEKKKVMEEVNFICSGEHQ